MQLSPPGAAFIATFRSNLAVDVGALNGRTSRFPRDRRFAVPLVTLDGDVVDGRFKVICGDGQNPIANLLPRGPLFRLQLVTTEPRQQGSHTIRLNSLRAVASDGTPIAAETNPTEVVVIVR